MRFLRTAFLRLGGMFRKVPRDAELSAEFESHLQMQIDESLRRGMTPEAARRDALIKSGGIESAKECYRDRRGLPSLETFWQDLRFAIRMLGKSPGFTLIAVLTLALGIGANTAIFSVVYAVLLKPLPYANPDQLVRIFDSKPQDQVAITGLSYVNFAECRQQSRAFAEMAANQAHDLTLTGAGEPAVLTTIVVTPEVFSLLKAKPLAGRAFLPEDGKRGAAPVVILSENLWRSQFGADPNLLGRSISLDKRSFTVVGIMPASFRFPLLGAHEDIVTARVHQPGNTPAEKRS